jgi:hypothetical protein
MAFVVSAPIDRLWRRSTKPRSDSIVLSRCRENFMLSRQFNSGLSRVIFFHISKDFLP